MLQKNVQVNRKILATPSASIQSSFTSELLYLHGNASQNFDMIYIYSGYVGNLHIIVHRIKFDYYMYIYQKPKNSVVWEGRPNFSFLFKSCEILEVRGDLSINVEDKKSLRVDRQACKNYALALVLCAFNNSKSI